MTKRSNKLKRHIKARLKGHKFQKHNPPKMELQVKAIRELLTDYAGKLTSRGDLEAAKRVICKKYRLAAILNSEILKEYRAAQVTADKSMAGEFIKTKTKIKTKNKTKTKTTTTTTTKMKTTKQIAVNELLEKILRKRSVRTLSGIAPVAVLTKPYPCPGQCAYCPHEKSVPTSYLSNEPAVMRAIRCGYDPYWQIAARLRALENNGHEPTKIEIIVIGGTWSYLPIKYKYWYILNCFRAANDYEKMRKSFLKKEAWSRLPLITESSASATKMDKLKINLKAPYPQNLSLAILRRELKKEQTKNETAKYKIIGLTLETRPDYINDAELREMRALGCTRVEIGVQVVDDAILKLNQRGHNVAAIAVATRLLKQYGFKVTYHLMPALPGATPAHDLKMFKKLFADARFQPDQIKFYPTVVTRGSLLYRWYRQGKYQPYSDKVLQELIVKCKAVVPKYVRIIRLIRDIPGESIVAGNRITNLRQIMKQRGVECHCIRCREVKDGIIGRYKIGVVEYPASDGREYFISADSLDGKTLYGFCRLRIDMMSPIAPTLVRELHVYGELVSVGGAKKVQHSGLGKELLGEAEKIAKKEFKRSAPKNSRLAAKAKLKIAVISGVGARGYYRKAGYKLEKGYMEKHY